MTKKNEMVLDEQPKDLAMSTGVKQGLEEPSQQDDLEIPRAKLMQSNSPEVLDNAALRPGVIINSVTQDSLPVDFLPIFKFTEWIRFNARGSDDHRFDASYRPGELIWRSRDPQDPRVISEAVFGPNGERPLATKFLNFFAYFPGQMMPVIISFSNTSFKAGKKLNSLCQFANGSAIFDRKYSLTTKLKENDKGKFFVYDVNPSGEADAADRKVAALFYEQFRGSLDRITVNHENDS